MGLTDEQIANVESIKTLSGTRGMILEAYRLGVAAEQKRIMSVLAKMIDGDSPGDHAITEAMERIERGDHD